MYVKQAVPTPSGCITKVMQASSCRTQTINTIQIKEKTREELFCKLIGFELFEWIKVQQNRVFDLLVRARPPQQERPGRGVRGLALQMASAIRSKRDLGGNLNKTKYAVADVLVMGAVFVALDMSRDGATIKRVLMVPPNDLTALMRVCNMNLTYISFAGTTRIDLDSYIYNASLPDDVSKMRGILHEALACQENLFVTKNDADTLIGNRDVFIEHVGVETILLGRTDM